MYINQSINCLVIYSNWEILSEPTGNVQWNIPSNTLFRIWCACQPRHLLEHSSILCTHVSKCFRLVFGYKLYLSSNYVSMSNVMNCHQPTAFYDTGFIVLSVHCQFVKTISFQHFQVFFTATWLHRNTTLMKLAWSRSCRSLLVFSTCCGQPYWKDACDTAALAALQCWITNFL